MRTRKVEENPETEKKKKKSEKDEDLDEDILPETGLNTPDGFLFYHTEPFILTRNQRKRVKDHGINLIAERYFTLEEAVLIFENWRNFAKEHKLKLTKMVDYINAKKSDKLLKIHQAENHFWPKLCSGLPHRTCYRIKMRIAMMMNDAFLQDLNWDDPAPQIAEKYYTYTKADSLVFAKTKKLMDKGYSASHVAEILDIPAGRAKSIANKLSRLDERNDPVMIQTVFESACSCGLDADRIPRLLSSGNEKKYYRKTLKHVNFEEMSLKIFMSEEQCKQFLIEKILKVMWKKYQKLVVDEEKNEEEAIEEAMGIVSPKMTLTNEQELKALEIFCQNVGKDEVLADLREKEEEVAKILRENGITGFQCNEPEYDKLCTLVYRATKSINWRLFENLRRHFRYQVKMHCVLWGWKKLDVWRRLPVKKDESHYEVVLRHELSNPFVSELTKRFLKNEHVAKWIKESSCTMLPKRKEHRSSVNYVAIEAFILYAHKKFKGEFKFPPKLHHLVIPGASETIQNILNLVGDSEDDNSEFLTRKEVKMVVENASDVKVAVKLKKKAFFVKKQLEEEDSESEDEENLDEEKERMEEMKRKKMEELKRQIEETIKKADPNKRKKKFQLLDEEGTQEQIKLQKELMAQKRVLNRAAKRQNLTNPTKTFTSREFVASESDDSDDDEKQKASYPKEELDDVGRDSDDLSASEDVSCLKNSEAKKKKRKRTVDSDDSDATKDSEVPDDVKDSEDVPLTSKFRKRKRYDSEDVEEQENLNSEDSEVVPKIFDVPDDSEDVGKKRKRRHRDEPEDVDVDVEIEKRRQDSENSEAVEVSEDIQKKKKKKRRHQNSEDPDDVQKEKKVKKRRRQNSEEDPSKFEVPDSPEASKKSKKKKRRRQNLEDVE